jgi:hypothetical protein
MGKGKGAFKHEVPVPSGGLEVVVLLPDHIATSGVTRGSSDRCIHLKLSVAGLQAENLDVLLLSFSLTCSITPQARCLVQYRQTVKSQVKQ